MPSAGTFVLLNARTRVQAKFAPLDFKKQKVIVKRIGGNFEKFAKKCFEFNMFSLFPDTFQVIPKIFGIFFNKFSKHIVFGKFSLFTECFSENSNQ